MAVNQPLPIDQIQTPQAGQPAPKPEKQGHLRVLSNGAVYDMNRKRIVDSKNVTTKITSENAVALQSRQQELKRAALVRAANAVAAQGGGVDGRLMQGDLAYVEAIGEAMTMKALSVNDPKAVDAARFIFNETGIGEAKQVDAGAIQAVAQGMSAAMLDVWRDVLSSQADVQLRDTIEGEVRESDSS